MQNEIKTFYILLNVMRQFKEGDEVWIQNFNIGIKRMPCEGWDLPSGAARKATTFFL